MIRMHSLRPFLWALSVLPALLAWQPTVQCQPATAEAPAKQAAPADKAPLSTVAEEFASPRNTIETFLINANRLAKDPKDDNAKRLMFKTLDAPETVGDERVNIAVKLLGVMNALGRIEVETMAPGVEKVTKQKVSRFEFFPDNSYPAAARLIREAVSEIGSAPPGKIILERMDSGEWKFSSETVNGIGETWSWIKQRGVRHGIDVHEYSTVERLRRALIPEAFKGRFVLGLELWQWVGLFAILFLALLIDYASRVVLRPPVRRLLLRSTGETDPLHVRLTVRPIGLLLGGLAFWAMLRILGLVGLPLVVLIVTAKLVVAFASAWTAWAVTDLVAAASARKAGEFEHGFDIQNMVIPLLRRTVKIMIIAFAMIYTASALEINLLPLLGSLGIAGLAVSFAAQDMVRNLFGGLTGFLDRPFNVGDRITYRNIDGIVENVGFRSTKLRTPSGHLVTIPNGGLTSDPVENAAERPSIRRTMNMTITRDTPHEKIVQAVKIIEGILEEDGIRQPIHPEINGGESPPRVYFNDFNANSLNIYVTYWFAPPAKWDYLAHCQKLNLRIVQEFEKAGIEWA